MIRETIAGAKTTLRIIWVALLIACGLYYFVIEFIDVPEKNDYTWELNFLYIVMAIGFISLVTGIYLLWNRTNPQGNENSYDYLGRAKANFIAGLATIEAVAIYGLVIRFIGITGVHVYFIGAAFLFIFLAGSRINPIMQNYFSLKELDDARR
jgi:hypothetical protein